MENVCVNFPALCATSWWAGAVALALVGSWWMFSNKGPTWKVYNLVCIPVSIVWAAVWELWIK